MFIGRTVLVLAAGLSAVLASPIAKEQEVTTQFFRRNSTSDLDAFKGALLLKNGKQTSCEVALMDGTYGFVAANCLDYSSSSSSGKGSSSESSSAIGNADSTGYDTGSSSSGVPLQMNQTTQYTVMVSDGFVNSFATLRVSKVTPNPQYDPVSFANNVALVEFDSSSSEFVNYIASWRPEWTSTYYVRRTLNPATNGSWSQPVMSAYGANSDDTGCAAANPLYSLNTQDLMCNTMVTTNIFNNTCSIPYGSVYGVVGTNTAIAALYSHSAVGIDSAKPGPFCHGYTTYNYYIVLQHYVHWAMSIMGRKAPVFHSHLAEYSEVLDPNYSMIIPSPKNVKGYTVYGGDLYNLKDPAASEEAHKKLSGGAIAGIVLALLALLGLLAAYFIRRRMKKAESNRVRRWWFFGRFVNEDEANEHRPPREFMDEMEYAPHHGNEDLMDHSTVLEPNSPRNADNTPAHPLKLKSEEAEEDRENNGRSNKSNPPSYAIEF
ncbi:hypothetical protein IW140_005653 [Coemansia sp. RSA 1813]|nr:hypothetical protein EV178_005250 [Coemansia sp. RSA 1646]KAJ1765079.1 hypothetical protein LPJ74_006487 [Coemansia sp. RSA 1843]KAJ2087083.1 hypothetical protein IW138_005240 [Coemansia sp. RSA 986]KAJ2212805.1 hypothetical protein EV179_004372 [Coemansia sp. RSA 487]KAJ2564628.1 hypothetical protein IW140_005653 [Coemansia sp. RSA 1813]